MRGQYSTHCRVRPHASGCVETPGRFFLCARCRMNVLICSCCDRGQVYCAGGCAQEARRLAQRAAGRRYQMSRRGRFAHALRARRYRSRRRTAPVSEHEEAMLKHRRQKNVTHQGSPPAPPDALLSSAPEPVSEPPPAANLPRRPPWRCHWCQCRCPDFVRQDFLRRRNPRGFERDHSP